LSLPAKATISEPAPPHPEPPMAKLAPLSIATALAGLALAGPAVAGQVMYSYDSVTPATEAMTESGITLMLDKGLMHVRVLKLVETLDIGAADLRPASDDVLGHGGLGAVLGPDAPERDLYEITAKDDGRALSGALCQGASKAWLAFSPIREDRELTISAVTRDPATGKPRLCMTLQYAFHGVWGLPPVDLPQPDRTDPFEQSPANRRF
jgi:hypothetical protein